MGQSCFTRMLDKLKIKPLPIFAARCPSSNFRWIRSCIALTDRVFLATFARRPKTGQQRIAVKSTSPFLLKKTHETASAARYDSDSHAQCSHHRHNRS